MTIRIAIDLELNCDGENPTEEIIQLGYSIFSTVSNEILFTGGDYVKIKKPLHPYIIKLTSITQKDIDDKGVSIVTAYMNMLSKFEEFNCCEKRFYQICEWGNGDVHKLKKELKEYGNDQLWKFGHSSLNIKATYQLFSEVLGINMKGGLKKVLSKFNLTFEPFKESIDGKIKQRGVHDARADALNTARIVLKILSLIKK